MGKKRAGRDKVKNKRYKDEGRREKNKARKALKREMHLAKCKERHLKK